MESVRSLAIGGQATTDSQKGRKRMATIIGMFERARDVDSLIDELLKSGYTKSQIGVVARKDVYEAHVNGLSVTSATEVGAITGGVTGGIAGLLIGLGALTIPVVGPIVAAGEFLTVIGATVLGLAGGAVAGGLVGALSGFGLEEASASRFAEGVKAGHILVTVQATTEHVYEVTSMMRQHNALEVDTGGVEVAVEPVMAPTTQTQSQI